MLNSFFSKYFALKQPLYCLRSFVTKALEYKADRELI